MYMKFISPTWATITENIYIFHIIYSATVTKIRTSVQYKCTVSIKYNKMIILIIIIIIVMIGIVGYQVPVIKQINTVSE